MGCRDSLAPPRHNNTSRSVTYIIQDAVNASDFHARGTKWTVEVKIYFHPFQVCLHSFDLAPATSNSHGYFQAEFL